MANIDRPMGLQIYGPLLRVQEYTLSAAYNTAVYKGDPVVANGTANDVVVATAGTGNKISGAVIAVYDLNHVPLAYWPANNPGVGYVLVADHPDQQFVIQDNAAGIFGINGCNGNVNLASGSGSTVTGISGWELAGGDTPGNTAGDQIRLVKPVPRVDNDYTLGWTDWIVRINNHLASVGIVGAGV